MVAVGDEEQAVAHRLLHRGNRRGITDGPDLMQGCFLGDPPRHVRRALGLAGDQLRYFVIVVGVKLEDLAEVSVGG